MKPPAPTTALVLTALLATACGQPPAPAPPRPSAAAPQTPAVTSITLTVTDGRVTPPARRITTRRGSTVRITVTSDTTDEFHLHGYDRTLRLTPGRPAVLELTATLPGVFEAELHHAGTRAFDLQVN